MMVFPLVLLALVIGASDAGKMYFKATQDNDVVMCPDETSKCPASATCCKLANGEWGCCQFRKATCCSDQEHCCPQGYSCEMGKQHCVQAVNNDTVPWAKKEPATVSSKNAATPDNMVCPDGTSCPGLSACCRTYTGAFRCCNYPNNVCCADGYHCCQRCSVCDSSAFKCLPGFVTSDWKTLSATESTPSDQPLESSAVQEGN